MKNLFIHLFLICSLYAGEPIQIGTSNSPLATAFNNARKIARTYDDRRVVVYQELEGGHKVIKLVYSDDGVNWSEPRLLAYGFSPTIAVSATDTFYVAWTTHDSNRPHTALFPAWNIPSEPLNAPPQTDPNISHALESVCLAVDKNYVHQVFHYLALDSAGTFIHYDIYDKQLQWLGVGGVLNKVEDGHVGPPTISCDLEYNAGPAHIVWSAQKGVTNRLKHAVIHPEIFEQADWLLSVPDYLAMGFVLTLDTSWHHDPSLSTRSYGDMSLIVGAFNNDDIKGLTICSWNVFSDEQNGIELYDWNSYNLSEREPSWPSVDDVIDPNRSCAVVWQKNGNIFYGQTSKAEIKTEPAQRVNGQTNTMARYPSVCYKTFRPDKFDVVWTEGTDTPYRIMYRRMLKDYSQIFDKMDILTTELPAAIVGQDYHAEIKVNYPESWHGNDWRIIDGQLPAGLDMVPYHNLPTTNGNLVILGTPKEPGEFAFTLFVQHPLVPREDYISLADTAEFTISVKSDDPVHSVKDNVPKTFQLSPVFPNPFNPTTRIQFSVPKTSRVDISIYDINGTFIQQLKNAEYEAGNFYIEWNASDVPSGAYLIHMQADGFSVVQKCLLLK